MQKKEASAESAALRGCFVPDLPATRRVPPSSGYGTTEINPLFCIVRGSGINRLSGLADDGLRRATVRLR